MIDVIHKAPHLYREDAYREYCWSVDAYGAYQPASFIYLCYEGFLELCARFGLRLFVPSDRRVQPEEEIPWRHESSQIQPAIPYGMILRLHTSDELPDIMSSLARGNNVLCLFPCEETGLWYRGDAQKMAAANEAMTELGVKEVPSSFQYLTTNSATVWWQEIDTQTQGRLFATKDSFLSDGFFRKKYGKSPQNDAAIESLVREFSTFKYPLLRMNPSSGHVLTWPCNEPAQLVYKIINHGPNVTNVKLVIEVDPSFEPVSPIERIVSLRSQREIVVPITLIPRAITSGSRPFFIKATFSDGQDIAVAFEATTMDVISDVRVALEEQSNKDDEQFSKLLRTFEGAEGYAELRKLPQLLRIDARACLNKIRSVAELVVQRVLTDAKRYKGQSFSDGIRTAQEGKLLSARSIGYLHTIRVIGNLASHPSKEELNETDVMISAYALASVTEEVLRKIKL